MNGKKDSEEPKIDTERDLDIEESSEEPKTDTERDLDIEESSKEFINGTSNPETIAPYNNNSSMKKLFNEKELFNENENDLKFFVQGIEDFLKTSGGILLFLNRVDINIENGVRTVIVLKTINFFC